MCVCVCVFVRCAAESLSEGDASVDAVVMAGLAPECPLALFHEVLRVLRGLQRKQRIRFERSRTEQLRQAEMDAAADRAAAAEREAAAAAMAAAEAEMAAADAAAATLDDGRQPLARSGCPRDLVASWVFSAIANLLPAIH